jgi:hypothetical protein
MFLEVSGLLCTYTLPHYMHAEEDAGVARRYVTTRRNVEIERTGGIGAFYAIK